MKIGMLIAASLLLSFVGGCASFYPYIRATEDPKTYALCSGPGVMTCTWYLCSRDDNGNLNCTLAKEKD
jgi:hypothetical protein